MSQGFKTGDGEVSKAQAVAEVLNRSLSTLVTKCTKSTGINDYFHVGVIGYGGAGVASALTHDPFLNKDLAPISLIGNYPRRIEKRFKKIPDGKGGFIDRKLNSPVWVEPAFSGLTPMCGAFKKAYEILSRFLIEHPYSFPPIVINITDGEASDGDFRVYGQRLMQLANDDGNVLLFNLHISSASSQPIQFPSSPDVLPDDYSKDLFSISSPLTSYMVKVISDEGGSVTPQSRGFSFNADFNFLIKFMDIGTRPKDLGASRDELNQLFQSG